MSACDLYNHHKYLSVVVDLSSVLFKTLAVGIMKEICTILVNFSFFLSLKCIAQCYVVIGQITSLPCTYTITLQEAELFPIGLWAQNVTSVFPTCRSASSCLPQAGIESTYLQIQPPLPDKMELWATCRGHFQVSRSEQDTSHLQS